MLGFLISFGTGAFIAERIDKLVTIGPTIDDTNLLSAYAYGYTKLSEIIPFLMLVSEISIILGIILFAIGIYRWIKYPHKD